MKKLVVEAKEKLPVVHINDLIHNSFIGIQWSKDRSFIMKVKPNYYIAARVDQVSSYTAKIAGTSIKDLLNKFQSEHTVYCFDTREELVDWICFKS